MTLPKRLVSLLLIYCFVITVAPHPRADLPSSSKPVSAAEESRDGRSAFSRAYDFLSSVFSSKRKAASDGEESDEEGLRFRLSEAPEQPEARPANKVADATTLSDTEVLKLSAGQLSLDMR